MSHEVSLSARRVITSPNQRTIDCGYGSLTIFPPIHNCRDLTCSCLLAHLGQTIAVLDTIEGVYTWRGSKADASHHSLVSRACKTYCKEKPLLVGRRVVGVQEGQEPLVFRARFEAWDDGGPGAHAQKFHDVYEQRVNQMSVSSKDACTHLVFRRYLTELCGP